METKFVRSEISRVGYVSAYDEVALYNYPVRLPSHNYVILDIDVEEELDESVNGSDLDDDARDFENKMREFKL